jgi:hypothetical protein
MKIVGIVRRPTSITTGIVSNIAPERRVARVSHEYMLSGTTWLVGHDEYNVRVMIRDGEIVASFDNWNDALAWKTSD